MNTSRRSILLTGTTAALSLGLAAVLPAQSQAPYADPQRSSTDSGAATSGSVSTADSSRLSKEGRKFIEKAAKSGMKETRLAQLALERTTNAEVRDYAQQLINDHQVANARLASVANVHGIMVPLETASASMQMDADGASTSTSSSAGSRAAATPSSTGGGAGVTGPSGGRVSDGDAAAQRGMDSAGSGRRGVTTGSGSDMHHVDVSALEKEAQAAVDKLARKSGAEFDEAFIEMMIEDHQESIDLFEEQAENEQEPMLAEYAENTLISLRGHLETARSIKAQLGS